MARYDKYGQIISSDDGEQSGANTAGGGMPGFAVFLMLCGIVLFAAFHLGFPGADSESSSAQTRPPVESRRTEQPSPARVTQADQVIRRGTRDVVVSQLFRNPDSRYPYRIHAGDRFVPVVLRDGERLVGRRLRIWREFTGNGREFRILRYEVIR